MYLYMFTSVQYCVRLYTLVTPVVVRLLITGLLIYLLTAAPLFSL